MLDKVLKELKKREALREELERLFSSKYEIGVVRNRIRKGQVHSYFLTSMNMSICAGNANIIRDFLFTKGVGDTVILGKKYYINIKEKEGV